MAQSLSVGTGTWTSATRTITYTNVADWAAVTVEDASGTGMPNGNGGVLDLMDTAGLGDIGPVTIQIVYKTSSVGTRILLDYSVNGSATAGIATAGPVTITPPSKNTWNTFSYVASEADPWDDTKANAARIFVSREGGGGSLQIDHIRLVFDFCFASTHTSTPTATPTWTPTWTSTWIPTHTPTATPSPTYTSTITVIPSASPTPTVTFTAVESFTRTPTWTPELTETPVPEPSPVPTPSPVPSPGLRPQDLALVHPYPNPIRPFLGEDTMRFTNLGVDVQIRIFTIDGSHFITLGNSGALEIEWDLQNASGVPIASGHYIWMATTPTGDKKIGRFAVIR